MTDSVAQEPEKATDAVAATATAGELPPPLSVEQAVPARAVDEANKGDAMERVVDAFAEVGGGDNGSVSNEVGTWEWMEDSNAPVCSKESCDNKFWLMRRRHHCRPCGKIFCARCCAVDSSGIRQCSSCLRHFTSLSSNVYNVMQPKARPSAARSRHMAARLEALAGEGAGGGVRPAQIRLPQLVSAGPPRKIFTLRSGVGDGAFGTVWEARDDRVGDSVAVKIIARGEAAKSREEALVNEIVLHQRVVNTHDTTRGEQRLPFPRLYDVFAQEAGLFQDAELWITMEMLDGVTLAQFLRQDHPAAAERKAGRVDPASALLDESKEEAKRRQRSIQSLDLTEMEGPSGVARDVMSRRSAGIDSERKIADYARQIIEALQVVHDAKLVFRDLKADNLVVEHDHFADQCLVSLVDFGSCVELPEGAAEVCENRLVGSLPYMAPEAWDFKYNQKSDMWAVGCLVYELVTGASPFNWVSGKVDEIVKELKTRDRQAVKDEQKDEGQLLDACSNMAELRQRMKFLLSGCKVFLNGNKDNVHGRRSEELVNFVGACLKENSDDRPTCAELLKFPFLQRYNNSDDDKRLDVEGFYGELQS